MNNAALFAWIVSGRLVAICIMTVGVLLAAGVFLSTASTLTLRWLHNAKYDIDDEIETRKAGRRGRHFH